MKKMQAKRSNRDKNERKAVIDSPAFLVYIGSDCFFFLGFFLVLQTTGFLK
jgi:heme/copper-type cytochrome/quinol oxidase subunit 3